MEAGGTCRYFAIPFKRRALGFRVGASRDRSLPSTLGRGLPWEIWVPQDECRGLEKRLRCLRLSFSQGSPVVDIPDFRLLHRNLGWYGTGWHRMAPMGMHECCQFQTTLVDIGQGRETRGWRFRPGAAGGSNGKTPCRGGRNSRWRDGRGRLASTGFGWAMLADVNLGLHDRLRGSGSTSSK